MKKYITVAVNDFKLIFRDPSLRAFFFLPLVLFAFVFLLLPYLINEYEVLRPYLSVIMVLMIYENTQMFSFINSMVLIDEKETQVAKVYGIIPVSKRAFIAARFAFPYLFTLILNFVLLAIQPFYEVSIISNLIISALAAMTIPCYVMAVNILAKNRMEGMVWIKAFNVLVLAPLAAFFVPQNFEHVFGIIPTHWMIQAAYSVLEGQPFLFFSAVGFLMTGALFWWLSGQFSVKHYQ